MAKSKPSSPSKTAPEDVLSSLEALLDEVASERSARADLLSGAPTPPKAKPAPKVQGADPAQIAALEAKLEKARTGLVKRDTRIAELKIERDALRAEIEELRTSRSWRITAPLRRLRGERG